MKNKNKKVVLYVCLLILCISIGYAALSMTLNITGESSIKSAKWDIHFDNLVVDSASVSATGPATINQSKNTIDYTVKLSKPGDSYSFTVDVVNSGTIDAMVSVVSNTGISDEQKKYVSYSVTYSNGLEVNTKDSLNAGDKRKLKVEVRYRTDLSASDLPNEDKPLDLTFKVTYVQADDSKNDVVTGSIMDNDKTGNYHSSTYKSKVTKIITSSKLVVPDNVVEKWDVSKNKDGSVMAYAEDDGNGGYVVTICSDGKIYLDSDASNLFSGFSAITSMDLSNINTSMVTNMYSMFASNSLTTLDLSNFDTSRVTNMSAMFASCGQLLNLNLKDFNTSNVLDMSNMFNGVGFKNIDVSSFDTSNVTNMMCMFIGTKLVSLDISNFNTSKVTNMTAMFVNCTDLVNLKLGEFDTSNVFSMSSMFQSDANLVTEITIRNPNGNYSSMFLNAALGDGAKVILNYTNDTLSIVDNIISNSKQASNANIVKGKLIV